MAQRLVAQRKTRRPWRLFALVRVLALLTVCLIISSIALFQVSKARAGDVLVQIGAQLMRLPDAYYPNGVQQLSLNGLTLNMQSGTSERPPEEVVQKFYDACRSRAGVQLDEKQRAGIRSYLEQSTWFQNAVDGVLVQESSDGTSVICIDPEGKQWDIAGIADAAQRFVASGELAELGRMRYAWVKPGESGSVFLTAWTTGPARLLEQFPRQGDAPGVDFPQAARVKGSQRFLSAHLADSDMAIYRHAEGELGALTDSYRAALESGGYVNVGKPAKTEQSAIFSYEKGRRHVVLTLKSGPRGSVMVSLLSQP